MKNNNKKFNEAIESLKKISMTADEKRMMLARIMGPAATKINAPAKRAVKSPWTVFVWASRHQWAYAAAILLVVVGSGGSVAFAAESSLPGDALYPIKVSVTEPIRLALAFSAQGKAKLAAQFANNRVDEGETLAAQGKLDSVKEAELSSLVAVNTQNLNAQLSIVASSDLQEAKNISADFKVQMDGHAQKLDGLVPSMALADYIAHLTALSTTSSLSTSSQPVSRTKNTKPFERHTYVAATSTAMTSVASSSTGATSSSEINADTENGNHGGNDNDTGNNLQIIHFAAQARDSGNQVSAWSENHPDNGGTRHNQEENAATTSGPVNTIISPSGQNTANVLDSIKKSRNKK